MLKRADSGKSLYFALALLATIASSARADEICGKVFGLDEIPEVAPALRRAGSLGGIRKAVLSQPKEIQQQLEILLRYTESTRFGYGFTASLFSKLVMTPEVISELTYYVVTRSGGGGEAYSMLESLTSNAKFKPVWINVVREFDAKPAADHGYFAGSIHRDFLQSIAQTDPAAFFTMAKELAANVAANPVESSPMVDNYAKMLNHFAPISLRSYAILADFKAVPGLTLKIKASNYAEPVEKSISAEDRTNAEQLLRFYGRSHYDVRESDGSLIIGSDPTTFAGFEQGLISMRDPSARKLWDPIPVTEKSEAVDMLAKLLAGPVDFTNGRELQTALTKVSSDTAATIMENWLNATIMDPKADEVEESIPAIGLAFYRHIEDTARTDLRSHLLLGKLLQLSRFFTGGIYNSMSLDYNGFREH